MPKNGLLVIISSPSGGGKDAVINALLNIFPNSARLVNTTARTPRPGQKEGVDYHFISQKEFENKIKAGDFLEYNNYAGHYYGTEQTRLTQALQKYAVVFSQIEVNGKHNLDKAGMPNLSIFLLPESLDILRERIAKRGGLTPEIIEERMKIARNEIAAGGDYDHQIVNKDGHLDQTIATVAGIVRQALSIGGDQA